MTRLGVFSDYSARITNPVVRGDLMQLVGLEATIKFDEATQVRTPARNIFSALGGKTPKTKLREPGVTIKNEKEKFLISWHYEECRIVLEETKTHKECLDLVVNIIQTIDSVAPVGTMQEVRLETRWLLPAPSHDFNSLNELYMRMMVSPKEFMKDAYDSSVIIDSETDDFVLHHQSGPMEPSQLLEDFLEFKRDKLPGVFIFLSVGLTHTKVLEYSREKLQTLFADGLHRCEQHAEDFHKIWEGDL
ncbi:MAG: hypothetical protein ISS52_07800 [Dehalococcoidia bacterium]|nr:hypothetical protein [Dehalococcoidia bacterium]